MNKIRVFFQESFDLFFFEILLIYRWINKDLRSKKKSKLAIQKNRLEALMYI